MTSQSCATAWAGPWGTRLKLATSQLTCTTISAEPARQSLRGRSVKKMAASRAYGAWETAVGRREQRRKENQESRALCRVLMASVVLDIDDQACRVVEGYNPVGALLIDTDMDEMHALEREVDVHIGDDV